jgi:hypothetical protein
MGKSDFEAVDQAVSCTLENGEVVMVSRVVQNGLQCGRHWHLGFLELSKVFRVVGRREKGMRGARCVYLGAIDDELFVRDPGLESHVFSCII